MKAQVSIFVLVAFGMIPYFANSQELTNPIISDDVLFEETNGLVAVEAEYFYKQTKSEIRRWYRTSENESQEAGNDEDAVGDKDAGHCNGAGNNAYVEALPDTRATHADKLIPGENFSDIAGEVAILHYKIKFNTPGRYYVWVRAYSSGTEDNGIHVGLDGSWPESGMRLQWCEGKDSWKWESKQRTEKNHCGEPFLIYLDIERPGIHEITFSMREDGFEFDRFLLTDSKAYTPEGIGPEVSLASGTLPKPFPEETGARNDEPAQGFAGPCSGVPSGLTVELIRDPRFTCIQDPRPEFSWIVPREAVIQKAYQILVSSGKELIEKNSGDVWNSRQVKSSQSSGIEFGGADLKPNTPYYWRVRILDKDNSLSGYSEIQEFTTGSFTQTSVSGNYFQIERIHPKTFIKNEEGVYLADFGKDAFATLELNFQAKKKKTLHIRLGEKLLSGRIDPKPGGSVCFQEIDLEVSPENHTYLIELIPDQRNTRPGAIALPDSFPVLMPFRYVEIAGTKELEAENLTRVAYFNYFDESASSFSSSNDILDKVWDLSKYSIKATTFSGYYVDGERERIPYEADAYLNQLSHYSVDHEYAMAQKTIEYLMKNPTWPTEWQLHMVFLFFQDYMYTGNTELIEQYYETLKHKTLMALANEEGLISTGSPAHNGGLMKNLGFADTTSRLRDIVDWPQKGGFGGVMGETDGFVFMPVNTVVNSFYYRNMVIMAEFARLLGKTGEGLDFQLEAERVKNSMNKQLFNKELGYYVDGVGTDHGSLHANMFPLAFDIVPEGYKKSVAGFIKTRGMGCSVYGAQYLLEALYKAGEADYALELLSATHDRSWYNMIRAGSTISMEAWDMKYKPNADWNHAWGAAPANLISRGMWGIQPLTPGFGLVSVKPQMGTLENSTIEVPTIKGKIRAEFERTGPRTAKYVINLPANMAGEFSMEYSPQAVVILNGVEVLLSFGSFPLKPGVNVIEIGINSF